MPSASGNGERRPALSASAWSVGGRTRSDIAAAGPVPASGAGGLPTRIATVHTLVPAGETVCDIGSKPVSASLSPLPIRQAPAHLGGSVRQPSGRGTFIPGQSSAPRPSTVGAPSVPGWRQRAIRGAGRRHKPPAGSEPGSQIGDAAARHSVYERSRAHLATARVRWNPGRAQRKGR